MAQERRFPNPFEVETIPGTEGWERMYPYFILFSEERKEWEEKQFWFWDKMHFPDPVFPFEALIIPYGWLGVGSFTTRVFAIPPANGICQRILNGAFYISPQSVTDPEIMGERVPLFQKRTAFYYEHWDELYESWERKMRAAIEELKQIQFSDLPKFEHESIVLEHTGITSGFLLLDKFHKLITCYQKAWQYHFEFLNLVYLAYLMFYEFCTKAFPEITANTIAKLIAGAPGLMMFQPDAEMTKLARLAVYLGVGDVLTLELSPEEIIAKLDTTDQGKRWLEAMEKAKDPWFYTSSGTGFYHTHPAWIDDLSVPFGHIRAYIRKIERGESVDRPVDKIIKEKERLAKEYRELLPTEDDKKAFDQSYGTISMAYPYAENHLFYVEHWFQSLFWNKVRDVGKVLVNAGFFREPDDIFYFYHIDVDVILQDLVKTWADGPGIPARGPGYWPKEVEWRKGVFRRFREWTPPAALGSVPETITEPFTIQLFGVTKETVDSWLAPRPKPEEVTELRGFPASSGIAEGPARVIRQVEELNQLEAGDILVCPITSPSWAPAFLKIKAAVTDLGGISAHAAIVCREYGLPAVVGTGHATTTIKTGDKLKVDGTAGLVTIER